MRRLGLLFVVLTVVVAGVGALHLPAARPLLARLGVQCPVDAVSAVQVETMHRAAVATLRGGTPAPTLDAFGLTILTNREAAVRQWAVARQMRCESVVRGMHYLSCANVLPESMGEDAAGEAIEDLTFAFDSHGVLVGVDALRGGLSGERAAALASSIERRLRDELGVPTQQAGAFSASQLTDRAYSTAFVTYRFTDYLVTLTAVQMPGRGVSVREQYVGIPPGQVGQDAREQLPIVAARVQ